MDEHAHESARLIEAAFKFQVGHLPVQELKAVADDSKSVQIAVLDGRMAQLEVDFKGGRLSAVEYAAHRGKVAGEREALTRAPDAKPVKRWVDVQDHVEVCPGSACKCPPLTYGKWWDTASVVERREKLIGWGGDGLRHHGRGSLRVRGGVPGAGADDWAPL